MGEYKGPTVKLSLDQVHAIQTFAMAGFNKTGDLCPRRLEMGEHEDSIFPSSFYSVALLTLAGDGYYPDSPLHKAVEAFFAEVKKAGVGGHGNGLVKAKLRVALNFRQGDLLEVSGVCCSDEQTPCDSRGLVVGITDPKCDLLAYIMSVPIKNALFEIADLALVAGMAERSTL